MSQFDQTCEKGGIRVHVVPELSDPVTALRRQAQLGPARNHRSSSRGESHPQALTDPDVNLSVHPAPAGRLGVSGTRCQWAKSLGFCCRAAFTQAHALSGSLRNRLNFCMAHLTRCWSMRFAMEYNSER